jgi:hypothetical protein
MIMSHGMISIDDLKGEIIYEKIISIYAYCCYGINGMRWLIFL